MNIMEFIKNQSEKELANRMAILMSELYHIYGNKSTDEYKMSGDITKCRAYSSIENMTANLSQLKGFPKKDSAELKSMFNALHRPIYKKMVVEYIHEQNEKNVLFTTLFTVGYRVLIGELSRIFASTVATDKGLVYKPDRISRNANAAKFIRVYNDNLDKTVDDYIRKSHKKSDLQLKQESFVYQEGVGEAIAAVAGWINDKNVIGIIQGVTDGFKAIFGKFDQFNPLSFMNYVLTSYYDMKVKAYYTNKTMYEETLAAYEDYKKIPTAQRDKKIESKYIANMKKYNIKMENLRAQIAHYDSRAQTEANDALKKATKTTNKPTTSKPSPDNNTGNDGDDLDW